VNVLTTLRVQNKRKVILQYTLPNLKGIAADKHLRFFFVASCSDRKLALVVASIFPEADVDLTSSRH